MGGVRLLLLILGTTTTATAGTQTGSFRAYFANGCFWGRQYVMINEFEREKLGRADDELTAITGYAGSAMVGNASSRGDICYHNPGSVSDYGDLGYAESVEVQFQSDHELQLGATVWFSTFIPLPGTSR